MAVIVGTAIALRSWWKLLDPPAWVVACATQAFLYCVFMMAMCLGSPPPYLYQPGVW